MKKLFSTSMALALFLGMATAHADNQAGLWLSPGDPVAKTITSFEDMWAHTACSSVPEALKAAFAVDFQGTAPNGHRYGKPTGDWGGKGNNLDCKLQNIRIRQFGDSVVVAYGSESSVSRKKDGTEQKHCLV